MPKFALRLKPLEPLALPIVVIVPFVLQTGLIVGLTAWLSYQNGQAAVNDLALRLCRQISDRVQQRLQTYLDAPRQINQLNAKAVQSGELDLTDPQALQQRFWSQVQTFQVSEVYFGNLRGGYLHVGKQINDRTVIAATDNFVKGDYKIYTTNAQGNRKDLLKTVRNYDPRIRSWYTSAAQTRKPGWSRIFSLFEERTLEIAATYPVYDKSGTLQGVLATGILLSHASTYLKQLNTSSGKTFIIERSGLLVATSTDDPPFILENKDRDSLVRVAALDSKTPLVRAGMQQLLKHSSLSKIARSQSITFDYAGKRQFLQVSPLQDTQGLNWLVVVVIPEAEFTTESTASLRLTIGLCLVALVVSLLLGGLVLSFLKWRVRRISLESQVADRTAQLQLALNYEALLKRITDSVRDSLDETQILQTAVRELALGLGVNCCDTSVYDLQQQTSTIRAEYIIGKLPSAQGKTIAMGNFAEMYQQLRQGQAIQLCWTLRSVEKNLVVHSIIGRQISALAIPMMDDRGVMGDLWLHKLDAEVFNETEIRLVQQVANQCAIALRQSRLYQAAQKQVTQLARLNQLKDDFLSTVSHELRTPMANIKMAIEMLDITLKQDGLNQEESRSAKYLQILEEECKREIELINDLLDLSRLESSNEPLELTAIDLRIWLPYMVEPFTSRFQAQQQQFQLAVADPLPSLMTERHSLERVFSELLNNACKYTPSSGTIAVFAQLRDTWVELTVQNSGVEIPPDELVHIFDKFYRIPNHDPWQHGGTGLGLALVQKLVDRIGGTVGANSSNDTVTFVVRLPVQPPATAIN